MKGIILLISMLFISACTNSSNAQRILEENGYTDIQITGYSWFACAKDDTFHTGFIARGPTGHTVAGTVCSGLIFKNSTIRFE